MQAYREVIYGRKLSAILNLPFGFRDTEVEVIVLPVERNIKKNKKLSQNWANALSGYRNQYTSLELQKKALDWRGD